MAPGDRMRWTWPARPGHGLWPKNQRSSGFRSSSSAKSGTVSVEPLLGGHLEIVSQRRVRSIERVAHLVALEDVVVGTRLGGLAVADVDRAPDRPQRTRAALDPDHDLLAPAVLAQPLQGAGGESHAIGLHWRKDTIAAWGSSPSSSARTTRARAEPARGISKEEALASYVVREHRQGRSLEDILDDPYLKNRATDEQRLRLLERPEVIRAVGEDTAAMAAERVREPT